MPRVSTLLAMLILAANLPLLAQSDLQLPEKKRTTLELYLNPQQAYELWKSDPVNVLFIDNRTPEEYMFVGHPPMARNIPGFFVEHKWNPKTKKPVMRKNPDFVDLVKEIAKHDDTIMVMCRSGGRSAKAVNELAKAGFTKVYTIYEGFEGDAVKDPQDPNLGKRTLNGWRNSGLPWTFDLDPRLMYLPSQRNSSTSSVALWGSLREAIRDGESNARVDVREVARPGIYGVGALEGLEGEVTVVDGVVWVTKVNDGRPMTSRTKDAVPATFLFVSEVSSWKRFDVPEAIPSTEFDSLLAKCVKKAGIPDDTAVIFRVRGGLSKLDVHVMAGTCPIRARMLDEKTSGAFEASLDRVDGTLVGVFAPDQQGVMTHHGSMSHVHAILSGEEAYTGHVESVGLNAGAILEIGIGRAPSPHSGAK